MFNSGWSQIPGSTFPTPDLRHHSGHVWPWSSSRRLLGPFCLRNTCINPWCLLNKVMVPWDHLLWENNKLCDALCGVLLGNPGSAHSWGHKFNLMLPSWTVLQTQCGSSWQWCLLLLEVAPTSRIKHHGMFRNVEEHDADFKVLSQPSDWFHNPIVNGMCWSKKIDHCSSTLSRTWRICC